MRLSFYYIPRSQTNPAGATHLHTIETPTISPLEQRNIKGISKKVTEYENIIKIVWKSYARQWWP